MKTKNENNSDISLSDARTKAERYCAKAERSLRAIKDKLYTWQVPKEYHTEIINHLYEANFLDEKRYALAFARDKHRFSAWGKERIKAELRINLVSNEAIETTLSEVFDEFDEEEQLEKILSKKFNSLKPSDSPRKHFEQLMRYGMYRGYRYEQIRKHIDRLLHGHDEDYE